ncbi:MAG: PmeII family type II restriction endonuclease, partial [Thermodesulfobacteriota bacterium]
MNQEIKVEDVQNYVSKNIKGFHEARLDSLKKLKLDDVLERKNPYLFKAKNIAVASDLVRGILDAHISSQEETLFGNFLEDVAIFVNENVYGGWKSTTEGIDLEFVRDGVRYVVSIKSGPNWGNSSQIKKMKQNFAKAKQLLRQGDKLV